MKAEIEIFRILSALGIVWFHSGVDIGRDVAYGGLIFFVVVAAYFATISTRSHGLVERTERLIVPYLIWGVFYGAINFLAKGSVFPDGYSLPSKLMASPAIHLWFLPFIFLSLVIIDNCRKTLCKKWVAILIGVVAIAAISSAPLWRELDYLPPLGQYFHALPAVLIGIFLGAMKGLGIGTRMVLLSGIGISVIIMTLKSQAGMGVAYLVGLLPCIFLFYGRTEKDKSSFILILSSATFGVYLFHIFWLMVLRFSGVDDILLPLLAFLLSLAVVIVVRAFLPGRYVRYLM